MEAIHSSNSSLTIGWQVRFERKVGYYSKFFSDSVYGGNEQALAAAREHRNALLRGENEELGLIVAERERLFILPHLPKSNTSGILGVHRSMRTESNGNVIYVWQSSYNDTSGKSRNKGFRISKHGEIGALIGAINFRREGIYTLAVTANNSSTLEAIEHQIEIYDQLLDFLSSAPKDELENVSSVLARTDIESSTKKRFVETRITQKLFRDRVHSYFDSKCCITGASKLLIASHIKPWAICSDKERIDPYNGILLSAAYDKAFDAGLISFDREGAIMIAESFQDDAVLLAISGSAIIKSFNPMHERYMQYHRANIFDPGLSSAA